jgi:invasion protein IalB
MIPLKMMQAHAAVLAGALALCSTSAFGQVATSGPDALSETYRDWIVTCRSVPADAEQTPSRLCEMTQELRQQQGGQRVLSVSLRLGAASDVALLTMITPFGLDVAGQVVIRTGDTQIAQQPFDTCIPAGCVVQGQLGSEALLAMRRGETASVDLPTRGDTPIEISLSLLGFTAALGRLGEL